MVGKGGVSGACELSPAAAVAAAAGPVDKVDEKWGGKGCALGACIEPWLDAVGRCPVCRDAEVVAELEDQMAAAMAAAEVSLADQMAAARAEWDKFQRTWARR